jgi:hypothetical protein
VLDDVDQLANLPRQLPKNTCMSSGRGHGRVFAKEVPDGQFHEG